MTAKTLSTADGVIGSALLWSCAAHAQPFEFPEIGAYPSVNIADYRIDTTSPGVKSSQVFFLTPDGVPCTFSSGTAGCKSDDLPGIAARDSDHPYTYIDTVAGTQSAKSTSYINNTVRGQQIKTLPPFHSITVGG